MATQRRASGVTLDTRGAATVLPALRIRRMPTGALAAAPAGGKGRRRAPAAPAPVMSEEEAVVNAMQEQQLDLLDAIPLSFTAPAAPAAGRRRAGAGAAPPPQAEVELAVPLREGELAVVLVDQGGVYEWKLSGAERAVEAAPATPARRRGAARGAAAAPATRSLVFTIALEPPAAAAAAPAAKSARRRGLPTRAGMGKAVVYVFRYLARPMLRGVAKLMERNVQSGLVLIAQKDPRTWATLADDAPLAVPQDRAARILLFVHGTFSSTIGSFGALAAQPRGQEFLDAALRHYDLVLGWDHRTLSVLPTDNAIDLAARLEQIGFAQPPVVDAVAYSRGGLVLRSLVEHVLPSTPFKLQLRRAVFVAAANGGTHLADPGNWHRLADRYTNLAAAGARAAALLPGFTSAGTILASAIRGIGVLVKVLASSAITDGAVPGLAAMEPDGDFIRDINGPQPGQPAPAQTWYCAVTSDFDPDRAAAELDPDVMPPGLLLKLGDKGADALFGKPNDLVVHVDSMTQIDEAVGSFIRERLDFGTNGRVHHCGYFSQPATAEHLARWFGLAPQSLAAALEAAGAGRRVEKVVRLRSTQPVGAALARVKASQLPWIVVERPAIEDGKAVTLRYAHPKRLGEEWLRELAGAPGATVHDAFELRETRRSHEVPMGGATPDAAPEAAPSPEVLLHKHGSAYRTIELDEGEPVAVVSPEPEMAPDAPDMAPAPATAARRAVRRGPPKMAAPPAKHLAPAPAAAGSVACHFRAESDDECVLQQVHTVAVTISREELKKARRAAVADASALVKTAKPLIVECMPMLRVAMADPDDARVEIPVPAAGQPAELRFDLVGQEAGPAQVRVQVRQGPLPLATLTLDFKVVPARSGTRRPVAASADLAEFPQLPLATDELRIIQMRPTGGTTQYRYELRLPSARVQEVFESAILDSDPAAYVAALHERIEQRWAQHRSEKAGFARDLRAIGCELFDQLFPLELRQLLWQHRQRIRSVQVLSSEPFIPWELVHLRDPAQARPGEGSAFLGELGVVRWMVNGYPPERLALRKGKARYVIPRYDPPNELPSAQEEAQLLKTRFKATEVAPEAEAIYRLLEQPGNFDLLHVACHGVADSADIASARLQMPGKPRDDGSLSEEHVLATTVRYEARLRGDAGQPIVVLNACQSGRGGYTLKGLGGFAEAFIEGGAGVFVGSSWSVGDSAALAFIAEFYAQFLEAGQPLAAAAAAARRKARDEGDATWLAYVVYGHPRAVVTRT